MAQTYRLPADAPHGFGGAALDRSKPLTFRLDGRSIEGFAGDTVLTALLANGITSAGTFGGDPVALDERSAPLVALRSAPKDLLPMERMPALSGLDLFTTGVAKRGPVRTMAGAGGVGGTGVTAPPIGPLFGGRGGIGS